MKKAGVTDELSLCHIFYGLLNSHAAYDTCNMMATEFSNNTEFVKFLEDHTSIEKKRLLEIAESIPIETHRKGEILIRQGEESTLCFFVLHGCLRQYCYTENGAERTVDFITEGQFYAAPEYAARGQLSDFFLSCVEDSTIIVGNTEAETSMYEQFPELKEINLSLVEQNLGAVQQSLASFKSSTPEERYLALLDSRPDLVSRVPQHQIASYLGITPESLSRIKKRLA